jgi:hypothetical protein
MLSNIYVGQTIKMKRFEKNRTINEIIERLRKKQLIPFIGTGMSSHLGLPDWQALVDKVAIMTGQNKNEIREKRDLLVAIEYLVINGHDKVRDILLDLINKPIDQSIKSRQHECLVQLDTPTIYTTNWDNIIEMTYDRLSKPYNLVERASDFLAIDPSITTIIKYHGSLRHPETLVITESDYYDRFGIDSPFDIRLRADLLESSLLFLGYSLRDYNVRYIWNRTQKILSGALQSKKKPPPSYFISVSRDKIFETVLRKNNIIIVNLDTKEEFPCFLEYLVSKDFKELSLMNMIETNALKEGYFKKYLDSYPKLHEIVRDKYEKAKFINDNNESYYWGAFGKFQYMIFENLRYLFIHYEHQKKIPEGKGYTVYYHLPTFMSTYIMGFPIEEYLRFMMYLRGLEIKKIDKNIFIKIMNFRKEKKEVENVSVFLKRISQKNNFSNICRSWEDFKNDNKLRNALTHQYRLLWWKIDEKGPYGFPKSILNPEKIKDAIWDSISSDCWEEDLKKLSKSDFISGGDLIKSLHEDISLIVNNIFKAFILDI